MRKGIALLLAAALLLSLASCAAGESPRETRPASVTVPQAPVPAATTKSQKEDSPYVALEGEIEAAVETVTEEMLREVENLASQIDDYDTYLAEKDRVDALYGEIQRVMSDMCILLMDYSICYAEAILNSGRTADQMYDDMEEIYEVIYEDAAEDLLEGIYEDALEEVLDAFYSGALDDLLDHVEYAEWSDVRSLAYEQWSDCRSEVYGEWSDMRSDVYGFCSDVRSELYGKDLEDAWEEIEDFREDVEKLRSKESPQPAPQTQPTAAPEVAATEIRPEFQAAMEEYEAFFEEYVRFMASYQESGDAFSMLEEYTAMLQQYAETMTALQKIEESILSEEEALYYTEVMLRINQLLLEA